MSNLHIAVIGAGVVGVNTALILQKEFPNSIVDIIAEKFDEDTTSDGSAGLFLGTNICGPNLETENQWLFDSFSFWSELKNKTEPLTSGIEPASGYFMSNRNLLYGLKVEGLKKILPTLKYLKNEDGSYLELYNSKWMNGFFIETLLIECKLYLPWAREQFKQNGGKIITRKINDFNDLADSNYGVIVNCTGLGAKYLCKDSKLVPIRGQVQKVEAPWLKQFILADEGTYVIPGITWCTIGGTNDYNWYSTEICPHQRNAIREKCEKLVPSLKNAQVQKEWVGLRPYRTCVRVESEIFNCSNGKQLKLVHNYGHGGSGVTTSAGTAKHAVELVKQLLMDK